MQQIGCTFFSLSKRVLINGGELEKRQNQKYVYF